MSETPEPKAGPTQPRRRAPSGLFLFVIIALSAIFIFNITQNFGGEGRITEVTWGELEFELKNSAGTEASRTQPRTIKRIVVEGNSITAYMTGQYTKAGKAFDGIRAEVPPKLIENPEYKELFVRALTESKNLEWRQPNPLFRDILLTFGPWLLLIVIIWYFFIRQLRNTGGTGNVLNFGRSRAKFITSDKVRITFEDVAGVEEAKEEVKELVEFLKNPKRFRKLGGRIPRGILLVGPPGTGKTLLAKAIAGEAGVPFFSISGSDFVEMFVGVGAARVRDLFKQSREQAPAIIFLDEIDAVGRRRGSGLGGGHDEREQTLNQILVEMDGFGTDESVIVIAATNRPDILDPALLRPGRFDREVVIDLPDVKGREEILKVHARKVRLAPDVNLSTIARTTPGSSGADLAAIINEAAILATMKDRDYIFQQDLDEGRDKVLWGRQKKSKVMDESEKRVTAYHEGGHALVAQLLAPVAEPVHKVTIIPRGMSLGSTMRLPERDRYIMQKSYFQATMCVAFGGRAAEEVVFGDISNGARDDIHRASQMARMMVREWGMSEAVGPVSYEEAEEHLFLGREIARSHNHSNEVSQLIDREVKNLIDESYKRARELIVQNRDKLERLAQALLKYETLSGDEVVHILRGEDIERLRQSDGSNVINARPRTPDLPGAKPKAAEA
jgi:cell division protease FtsH